MSNVNDFPIDIALKNEIACLVTAYMARLGISVSDTKQQKFQDEYAERLIESVLDAILDWEERKLN